MTLPYCLGDDVGTLLEECPTEEEFLAAADARFSVGEQFTAVWPTGEFRVYSMTDDGPVVLESYSPTAHPIPLVGTINELIASLSKNRKPQA